MKKVAILVLVLMYVNNLVAEVQPEDTSGRNITITGNGYMMFGQVVTGYAFGRMGSNRLKNHWQNFYAGRINAISQPTDWFTTKISLEIASSFPIIRESTIMKETYRLQARPFLPQAVGIFDLNFDDYLVSSMLFECGLMEYAFNPHVKNLGNYMYRSFPYPLNISTKLDYIYSNLLGMRVQGGTLGNQLKLGAIINSIINQSPFFDMNVSLYASYSDPQKVVDASAGICFDRIIALNDTLTRAIQSWPVIGDTTLSLKGTKLDAYVSIDIKKILNLDAGDNGLFGKNDLKIYTEAALIGLKDPDYYPNDTTITPSLLNRLPVMLGVNLPVFKILDLLSVEVEWLKYPYANDWWGFSFSQPPTPKPFYPSDSTWRKIYKNGDNWKWTVYIKKSISKFDLLLFFANDHVRYETYSVESHQFTEQSLRRNTNWHWYVKLQYNL